LLLADDSVAIQKVIDLTFTDEGMDVTTVGDGQDALDKLNQFIPDVVLADVFMPGVDGYELCKFIKEDERFRGVPVMLLVGSFEPFDESEAKRVGADDVVTKPFQSIRDLVSRVGSLVGQEDESANKYSVLGLDEAGAQATADAANEVPAVDVSVVEEQAAEQPNVKVFVEAPLMETSEPPVAEEHTCPPDIELQTADTQQLEPIVAANDSGQDADTIEVEVVEDNQSAASAEVERPMQEIRSAKPVDNVARVETAAFDDEGVLDLGDIDSFSSATVEDEFELDIDVEPLAMVSDAVMPDNEPPVEQFHDETTSESVAVVEPAPETSTDANANAEPRNPPSAGNLSAEAIDAISRRVVEHLSDRVVREIAWEVVPELSELLIKKRLEEQK
jgi:CheY-like chemotaxis protein